LSAEAPAWPSGLGRVVTDTVDSTNRLAQLVLAGNGGRASWVMAGQQTAGRGRRGRPWSSPRGNFYGTLAMRLTDPPALRALRSFVAALALRDALAELTGAEAGLRLKWPNDVLLNGGKVAGILLENAGDVLCVGIGVNLIAGPDDLLVEPGAVAPVTVLAETGQRLAPETLLNHLAPAFARWDAMLRAAGFQPLRKEFLAHAAKLGQQITARTGTQIRQGRYDGLDENGALILTTSQGTEIIPAAEVFF
jgi:BirA family transcriptional regulator, biotin operon repressor / biotin---[acetyl-CoA-carboxylase] ligase